MYSNNQESESTRLSDTLSFFEDGKVRKNTEGITMKLALDPV